MQEIINPDTLVVKKSTDFLEATGLTEKIIADTHRKFIGTMNDICGVQKKCTSIGYKKFLSELSVLEQKAVLFFALFELNRATNEMATKKVQSKKKIVLPNKKIV